MLRGYIDHIDTQTVSGWVRDSRHPDTDLFVELCGPDGPITTIRANLFREDLQKAGIGDGWHGFRVTLPDGLDPGAITARVPGQAFTLKNKLTKRQKLSTTLKGICQSCLGQGRTGTEPAPELQTGVAALDGAQRSAHFAMIRAVVGSRIEIWTTAPPETAIPAVIVDGKPAWMSPDRFDIPGHPEFAAGYNFYISGIAAGAEIALCMVAGETAWLSETRPATQAFIEHSILQQMHNASRIAARSDAVALACWDGTAAETGRAIAALNALSPRRPAVLFCFLNDVEGLDMAPLLAASRGPVVTIPWSERVFYLRAARMMGLRFDTVWIFAPGAESLQLAAQIAGPDSRLVLDMADGPPPAAPGLARWLISRIPARTAASTEPAHTHEVVEIPQDMEAEALAARFEQAEARAATAPRAGAVLATLPGQEAQAPRAPAPPTLLLIWKQQDAGLYGRRLDQICRSYRRHHPDHRVVVLEVLTREMDDMYRHPVAGYSEFTFIREMNTRKQQGRLHGTDGTEYRQIRIETPEAFHPALLEFLVAQDILPANSVVILFPNILHAERVMDLLHPYPLIVDVVDNQLAWASGAARLNVLQQYFMLCQQADRILFNSRANHDRFRASGLIGPQIAGAEVIPNWYQLPEGFAERAATRDAPGREADQGIELIYTGNMNDRIDWPLLEEVIGLDPHLRLHLVGEARHASAALLRLLQNEAVIFHGPLDEDQTLTLLMRADLAVIPHVTDEVSAFMNPLKAHMYRALGLPAVAMNVPGLTAGPGLTIAPTRDAFLEHIAQRIAQGPTQPLSRIPQDMLELCSDARAYIDQIDRIRANSRDSQETDRAS